MSAELDGYCARIGYAGPRAPSLAVLRALVLAHATTIPFENIDVLLKRPVRLDTAALFAKLVRSRRGGYCFEHNLLLLEVLRAFGFRAHGLAARVQWGRPAGEIGPRTHMLLLAELAEGPHIADVGFGGLTPTAPLALAAGREQATPHEAFRLTASGAEFDLQARLGGDWASLYRFSLQKQLAVDYEVANWFTSTYPESLFVNHLIASRAGPHGRCALFNTRLTRRPLDGVGERHVVRNAAELGEALARDFGIALSGAGELAALMAAADMQAAHPSPFDAASAYGSGDRDPAAGLGAARPAGRSA